MAVINKQLSSFWRSCLIFVILTLKLFIVILFIIFVVLVLVFLTPLLPRSRQLLDLSPVLLPPLLVLLDVKLFIALLPQALGRVEIAIEAVLPLFSVLLLIERVLIFFIFGLLARGHLLDRRLGWRLGECRICGLGTLGGGLECFFLIIGVLTLTLGCL